MNYMKTILCFGGLFLGSLFIYPSEIISCYGLDIGCINNLQQLINSCSMIMNAEKSIFIWHADNVLLCVKRKRTGGGGTILLNMELVTTSPIRDTLCAVHV